MNRLITSTIPYVNASPHIGFALELLLTDSLARHARHNGDDVYFLTGSDENSLKNVLAAEAARVPTREFVDARATEFEDLLTTLEISNDDFIRTSADPRHEPTVAALWHACWDAGDLYQDTYDGLYCIGCEQFYRPADLADGRCPEHDTEPERIHEDNYFFRLSRYQQPLLDLIESGRLIIRPENRRNEVLAFLRQPLDDLSVTRSVERAHGWGLRAPNDSSQVLYVWFDALVNYVSAYGLDSWQGADRITHVVGKGVTRFHAVYWPAFLLAAGWRLPDEIFVHGYVTVDGAKISKSGTASIDPGVAAAALGLDALRYSLLRHVGSFRDGDFSLQRLATHYEHDLANQLGNLASRVLTLCARHGVTARSRSELGAGLQSEVDTQMEEFAVHRALNAIWSVVERSNAFISEHEPWRLAKAGETASLRRVLGEAAGALAEIATAVAPFLPGTANKLRQALAENASTQLFPRRAA